MKKIYCIGDCLTQGIGADYSYPYFLGKIFERGREVINMGRTMIKAETLIKFPDLFMPEDCATACVWCGTNDLFFETNPNIVFSNLKEYCGLLSKRSINIFVLTVLPRSNGVTRLEEFENNRKILNNMIRENFATIDIAKNEKIGLSGCENNKSYYNDKDSTHLNNLGYMMVGTIAAETILKGETYE